MKKSPDQNSAPRAPRVLSKEAAGLWRTFTAQYDFDAVKLTVLQTTLEAFDRMRAAQKAIEKDGPVIKDRFDQDKAHPAVVIERDSRAAFMKGLAALGLELKTAPASKSAPKVMTRKRKDSPCTPKPTSPVANPAPVAA